MVNREQKILLEQMIDCHVRIQRAWAALWDALEKHKTPQLCLPPHKEEDKS